MIKHISDLKDKPRRAGTWRVLSHEEAARVRAQDTAERNAHRLPPEAYTKFLLQAKHGEIAPGEADRRVAKYGGSTKVQPIRPFPRPPRGT